MQEVAAVAMSTQWVTTSTQAVEEDHFRAALLLLFRGSSMPPAAIGLSSHKPSHLKPDGCSIPLSFRPQYGWRLENSTVQ